MVAHPTENGDAASADTERHPYDYYWRPGRALRPAPPRLRFDPMWTHSRRTMLSPWIEFREVPAQTPFTRLVVDHMWQGDELMDAVVERFRTTGMVEGRALLEQALDHGIESLDSPPQELVALFAQLDNPPAWYDPQLWEKGRQLWNNASLAGKLGMVVGDVLGTFVGDEVAYATGQTGRFVSDFFRRNLETFVWFRNMTYRNALDRHADPFKDTVRVRLMHSQVRAGLHRSWGEQHFAHHANPISNAMMMIAAATFGLQPLLIDHQHGRTCTREDLDAAMMYWSYIAYVFGVAEEIIPKNAAEAMEMLDFAVAHAGGPSHWTETMIGAAVNGGGAAGLLKQAVLTPVLGLIAYYSGADVTRALVRGTDMAGTHFVPWIPLGRALVLANIGLRRVFDRMPGAASRAAARESDTTLWETTVTIARFLAARHGIHGTPYDHHNQTAGGCPVPHATTSGCPMPR